MTTTSEDYAYGSVLNLFGSDPETAAEHDTLMALRFRAERSHLQRGEPVHVTGAPDYSDFDATFLIAHADTGRAIVQRACATIHAVPIPCVTAKAA